MTYLASSDPVYRMVARALADRVAVLTEEATRVLVDND